MKKNIYTVPKLNIVEMNVQDGILFTASDGQSMLGNGGTTSGNVTSSDVKRDNYSVWNDDWSK